MSQQLLFYWWSLKKQIKGKQGQLGMSTHLTTIILTFTSFMTSLSRQPADGPNLPISSTWYHHNRPKPPPTSNNTQHDLISSNILANFALSLNAKKKKKQTRTTTLDTLSKYKQTNQKKKQESDN